MGLKTIRTVEKTILAQFALRRPCLLRPRFGFKQTYIARPLSRMFLFALVARGRWECVAFGDTVEELKVSALNTTRGRSQKGPFDGAA